MASKTNQRGSISMPAPISPHPSPTMENSRLFAIFGKTSKCYLYNLLIYIAVPHRQQHHQNHQIWLTSASLSYSMSTACIINIIIKIIISFKNIIKTRHEKSAFVFPWQRLRVPKWSLECVKLTFSKIATNMCKPGF